ncbi:MULTISPECIES: hypothetical protein [unclassified Leptotrichia]|jgi:hypothetical protein|uniref:hypothetical protein n=1 Tax=unclassified Leptotrichia TaxID=2633022 RepID=UPI0003AE02F4|nr:MULTISPECIES: hypothetical protein [unclassified Leptotrichia]ERL26421.1 hypothetical protein HMPREF9108_00995 [Leptotrichia sp. oral taxon 225 str. F0581]WLD75272.1 hypothetical protein QU666_05225 [Leptotrichia sp. HMT-225]
MSKKIKKLKNNNFKNISEVKLLSYPVFCFRYLTKNKNYNFNRFKNSKESNEAKGIVLDKLMDIQLKSWLDLHQQNKRTGIETLSIENINFSPYDYETSKDQKVYVFRLNSQNWRMIGIKSEINTDVLHIIGFDFDFTAYNHGK